MDNISLLLQEAKPLYFQKKREKREFIKISSVFACLFFIITPFVSDYYLSKDNVSDVYTELYYDTDSNYYIDEFDAFGVI